MNYNLLLALFIVLLLFSFGVYLFALSNVRKGKKVKKKPKVENKKKVKKPYLFFITLGLLIFLSFLLLK